ncbi:hypothetical protein [Caulobacter sp. 602-1]|uniref:hypothetical protein n=1 Tax=Caulobacter sp. 602-1 TaxID=2492472 RepID=UPI001F1CC830|nr:hypothetical protein [Caulobacter sp. 602-1]
MKVTFLPLLGEGDRRMAVEGAAAASAPPLRGPPPSRCVFASIHLPLMGRRDPRAS